ncbi:unnamed protein product [Hanseniaspora opuntiae]
MSDAISLLSKNSEQQKDSIKNDTHRKKSLDRIEMMKFLENIIQEEDQYRYQQSFQNENTSAIDFNLSPKSIGSTPTPFNNNRRSFSRSNSITRSTILQKETTLTNTLNDVIINFQYDNRQNSIRIMDEERERLRQLIYNDKNEIIPPMFMQKREKPKFEKTKRRHSSVINDVTPEPEEKNPKVVFNNAFVLKLKTKLMLLESEKELNMNKIKGLDKDLAEKSELINDLKQNEHKLLNQLNKDKILIDKLIKELASKDKQNFILAQSLKK